MFFSSLSDTLEKSLTCSSECQEKKRKIIPDGENEESNEREDSENRPMRKAQSKRKGEKCAKKKHCPVCSSLVSEKTWRKHLSEHNLFFCIKQNEIFTKEGNKWEVKGQTSSSELPSDKSVEKTTPAKTLDVDDLSCQQMSTVNGEVKKERPTVSYENDALCKEEIVSYEGTTGQQSSDVYDAASVTIAKETNDQSPDLLHKDLPGKQVGCVEDKTTDLSGDLQDRSLEIDQSSEAIDESTMMNDSSLCHTESITENVSTYSNQTLNLHRKDAIPNENSITVEDFVYTCFLCNLKFLSFKQLRNHKVSNHRFRARYGPNKMSIVALTRKRPVRKRKPLDENKWKCPDCNKKLSSLKVFKSHMEVHLQGNKKCMVCSAEFNRVCALKVHYRKAHADEQKFPCSICNINFSTKKSFEVHQLRHKRDQQGVTGPIIRGNFLCEHCGKKCLSQRQLTFHMFRHNGQSYQCELCPQRFTTFGAYNQHRRQHKQNTKAGFVCKICGAKYYRVQDLKSHNYRAHVFKKTSKKSRENRSYGDSGTYTCNICDKVFMTCESLAQHRSTHLGVDPSSYTCPFCNKVFKTKYIYVEHFKIHTGEKTKPVCQVCQKVFSSAITLKDHMSIHDKVRKYECAICHAKFRERRGLTVHYRYHSGEKPYACSFCDYRSVQKHDRDVHQKRHLKQNRPSATLTIKQEPSLVTSTDTDIGQIALTTRDLMKGEPLLITNTQVNQLTGPVTNTVNPEPLLITNTQVRQLPVTNPLKEEPLLITNTDFGQLTVTNPVKQEPLLIANTQVGQFQVTTTDSMDQESLILTDSEVRHLEIYYGI